MKKNILLTFFVLLFVSACTTPQPQGPTLTFTTPNGVTRVSVELSTTLDSWAKGLMDRQSLPENHGMLFVFPDERETKMWMKDTKMSLDMVFMNKDYTIIDLKENFQTCTDTCNIYTAQGKPQYVLEVNTGFINKNGIKVGDTVRFSQ